MDEPVAAPERVPTGQLVAYSLLEAPQIGIASVLALFLTPVYGALGISVLVLSQILFVARLSDVVTDPVIGWLSDRTPGRFGRRRPWIVVGGPLMVLAVVRVFLPPEGVTWVYLLGWLFVLWLGWTMVAIPYYAWGAELSPDYRERTRISTTRTAFGYAGVWLMVSIPTFRQLTTGEGGSASEVMALAAAAAVVAIPLGVLSLACFVPESPIASSEIPIREGLRVMWSNRPFRRLLAGFTLSGLGPALQGPLYIFFSANVVQEPAAGPLVLIVFYTANIPGVLLWAWLANRIEKHRAWMCGMGVMSCATPLYLLLGPGDLPGMVAILFLCGIGAGAFTAVPASMKADVIDLDTLESGEDRAGAFFAAWSLAAKIIASIGPSLALAALAWIGFDASRGATNPPAAIDGLRLFFSFAPMLCYFGGLLIVRGYPLTSTRHAELRSELKSRAPAA
jgi:Na+/melibiose symporter-like transporter